MHHPWWCILFVCLFFLQGCGALDAPDGRQVLSLTEPVELSDTPFFPQKKFQCGPAALATLLQMSDVPVVPAELEKQVYLPKRKGSLQAELLAAVRRYDRLPYVLQDTFTALAAELAAGNPVLVLQNLGFSFSGCWSYRSTSYPALRREKTFADAAPGFFTELAGGGLLGNGGLATRSISGRLQQGILS
jgi:hypothetical protein